MRASAHRRKLGNLPNLATAYSHGRHPRFAQQSSGPLLGSIDPVFEARPLPPHLLGHPRPRLLYARASAGSQNAFEHRGDIQHQPGRWHDARYNGLPTEKVSEELVPDRQRVVPPESWYVTVAPLYLIKMY
jgi:hypothetical protein